VASWINLVNYIMLLFFNIIY